MPVWPNKGNALRRVLGGCVLSVALGWLPAVARADFKVMSLQPRLVDRTLSVNGSLQLELSHKVEEAVSKGIELPVVIELRLYRKRPFLWDRHVASWSLRRSLRYHALSGQYLVGFGENYDNFFSASDALKYLGTLSDLSLKLPEGGVSADEAYEVKLRVSIDIEGLPAPLRPVAYTTLSWHLNSGWTTWNVSR